jgi:hypothetical protein
MCAYGVALLINGEQIVIGIVMTVVGFSILSGGLFIGIYWDMPPDDQFSVC